MAKLTTILYASAANIPQLVAEVKPSRDAGQRIRLIALEEFRGETEQNAGAVYIQEPEGADQAFGVLVDAIATAYPHLELQPYRGFEPMEPEAHVPSTAENDLRDLRLAVIAAGGSAPANATAAELADILAAQKARQGLGSRTPVLPTPATQGTVIPDGTPVVQRGGADKLVSESAVGTSPEALGKAQDEAGVGANGEHPGAFTEPASQVADLSKVSTHKEADKVGADEGVDLSGKSTVADKVAAIKSARDAKAQG